MSREIEQILKSSKTIAVVGLSDNPDRPSYHVSEYMQLAGYRIIPVNPSVAEVLGEKSYPNLKSIPEKIDIVDIFRKPDAVPEIVNEAIAVKAKSIWMQEGVIHEDAALTAQNAGLQVVMDKCILKEHMRWGGR
jgi:uncharacterized protein